LHNSKDDNELNDRAVEIDLDKNELVDLDKD
jgi:hypothetical protein